MVAQFSSDPNDNVNVPQTPEIPTPEAIEDNGFTLKEPLNPQPSCQESIDWLLELGRPPLPVAPAQDPHLYPLRNTKGEVVFEKDGVTPKAKFTGKNPSYLDLGGIPHTVSHGKYQKRQPTKEELDTWFANPLNGVGSLGSDKWAFVDLDRHKFNSDTLTDEQAQELCDEAGQRIIDAALTQTQKLPPYEKTQSYGWRVVIGLSKPPDFTNFCLTPGGVHVGEVLGKGRFAVLAPTIGPSGNAYECYHRCPPDEIPVIDELEKLTLHPVKASRGRPKNPTGANDSQPTLTPVLDSSTPDGNGSSLNVDGSTPNVDASSSNSTSHAAQILKKYPELRDKVFDLRDLGTDKTRDVLAGVDEKGDRSGSLTTAVRDWYGWENWCRANGFTYRGDTRSLALEAGDKLNLDDVENRVDRILKGIDASSCTTSCEYKGGGDDEGCWRRIVKLAGVKASKRFFTSVFPAKPLPSPLNANVIPLPTATPLPKAVGDNGSGSGGSGGKGNNRNGTGGNGGSGGDGGDGDDNGKVVKLSSYYLLSDTELEAEIEKLIAQSLPESKITSTLNRLAQHSQRSPLEVRKQYQERLNEAELELEREANYEWIVNLRRIAEEDLSLSDYLPPGLTEPLTQWCTWLSVNQSVVLTALLTATSSLHAVGTELMLHEGYNFRVIPTIFSSLIAESGLKKSPIFNNIAKDPLHVLRKAKVDAYLAKMEEYKKELLAWKQLPKDERGEEPVPPPPPTLYYFDDATGEAISVQAAKAPSKALFGLIDELSGFFNSRNAYRSSARGRDKEDILSLFDGTGKTVLRAGEGVRADLHKIYLSLFGTIQPEILTLHMGDCSDADGHWARFIFVRQPLRASRLADDDGTSLNIKDLLADVYRKVDNLPPIKYRLSSEAFAAYQIVYDQLERLKLKSKPGLRAMYSKMEGYIGRLAINLHVLWELAEGKACPDEEIPLYIMEMAIQLAKFYVSQVKAIHADADDENVPAHIAKMISLSQRLQEAGDKSEGWLKAKNVSDQYGSKKRPKATTIYAWMQEAGVMGLGSIRGSGNRMEFHWMPQGGNDSTDDVPPPDPTSPDPNFRNLRNTLGIVPNDVPKAETVESKGVEEDFRNFRNFRNDFSTPEFSTHPTPPDVETLPPDNAKLPLEEENVPKVPKVSPNDSSNVDVPSVDDFRNDVRNTLGSLPKVPKVAESTSSFKPTPPHDNLIELGEIAYKMFRCDTPAEVEKLYAEVPQELIEATKKRLGDDELLTFESIANKCANLPPAAAEVAQSPAPTPQEEPLTPAAQDNKDVPSTEDELVANARRQGKKVLRYVGEMRTWGVNSLAHNVLVERLGKDRFGLLVSVQRLGEKWAQPIDVCPKLLEEI